MDKYENTQIRTNMKRAFEDESSAHTRYSLYSRVAEQEGMTDAAEFFERAANEKLGQAGVWLDALGQMGNTRQNLDYAMESELVNQETLRRAANVAADEGFDDISEKFILNMNISKDIENAGRQLAEDMDNSDGNNPPDGDATQTIYICRNCGHRHRGFRRPDFCPLCGMPGRLFRRLLWLL